MNPRKIKDDIYWMGYIDWEARLFDELIPLPDGTSYNAYLIAGSKKTALIDSVESEFFSDLEAQLKDVTKLDYLVSLHAEQDHSGSIPKILAKYPEAKLVTSPKAKGILMDILDIAADAIITVADGEILCLGDKTLEFIHTPWVHWPETMVAYLQEDKILFSCDFFGSHIATTELFASDEARVYEAAKRYYAEVMMPFGNSIKKHLQKLAPYAIDIIAPSHGPLHKRPSFIIDAHKDWVDGQLKNVVILPYVSMHKSTKKMVDHLTAMLTEQGVRVELFNLSVTDIGKLAIALVDAGTIVVGTPTVLAGPHPAAAYCAFLANALRPRSKYLSIIGSYGWGGKTVEVLAGMVPNLKVEIIEPVQVKGFPTEEDLAALETLAKTIAAKHKEQGFV
ncbi:FprA family A-type flavoprotein [Desulfuromonas acetoxidans]|uniref:Beta-lactamase-like n=1 Tax=Desulfuromonas acetoxidans (strain DSM 684 / 11070) TaxID=281689 RepID=Q1K3I7_DESA6|nr:FprA family A-type flavoprotein [Desulfuromonas acetoxidans]EAT16987.1 beta-lactamase-like [Desulfuromonas acetoxidans DSM 684]MBF0645702.1 FprA family A-type flavoprotein [Desulfuromonas acetoxidans]NVD23992.1 FprA family A-type flavoprotein [Desulfuromonas acetoxidans]NVE16289.1 FprA family A-type flavoprotein [Desulfuromonas acetoxidans]